MSMAQITKPAETGLFADAMPGCPYPGNANTANWGWAPPGQNLCGAVETRHNDGANCAFLDGHAKWLHANEYAPGTTLWIYNK
jgi:prepilin-type processing-associated H-X9-DG protein